MTGKGREIAESFKKRRVDIACIQETRWKGAKARDIGDGYKMFYNGTRTNRNGVAIVVSERLRDCVNEINRISDRLMSIRIVTGTVAVRVVSCYAPQPGCPADEHDEFWTQLDAHLRSFDASETLFIGGDFNGHVGQRRDGFDRVHGGRGFGDRNDGGERLLEFAEASDLAVVNTFFRKRRSQLITYNSGGRETQIDYWLVRRRDLRLATDSKVIPSDNIATQHRLLVIDFSLLFRPPARRTTTIARLKWWKLPEHKDDLKTALGALAANEDSGADMWEEAATRIRTSAENTIGKTKPGRRFVDKQVWWWSNDVQEAVRAKKRAMKIWKRTQAAVDLDQYRRLKAVAKREVASAKSAHYNDLYERLDRPEGANDVYKLARSRHRAAQDIGHVMHVKDADGRQLEKPRDILRRWHAYFDAICSEEFSHPPLPAADVVEGAVPPITAAEVSIAIRNMKNGKATGPDDIPAEVWKLLGQQGSDYLAALFNKCVEENEIPSAWKSSVTVPIWKGKGDVTVCSNYRPIRLLCHTMKIFERIIDARIRAIVEISPNQCGFVKGCGTTDAIHAARLLMERHREKRRAIHVAFLDLEKAFDRVPHDLIWLSLRKHKVPEVYVRWIKMLYAGATSSVRCAAGETDPFAIRVGVHQGSALSPLLFILCMDTATADLHTPHPWTLLYADDVMVASETREDLERQVNEWKTRLDEFGMRLNLTKTEYVECGPQTNGTIVVARAPLAKSTDFRYLGSRVASDGDSLGDARARVNAAWMKWRQSTGVLCDQKIPIRLKSKIYRTVIRPVALYGAECWPSSKQHERALHTMEMRMLRWSLGLTLLDHAVNEDVRRRLGVAPIQDKMREARLRWYGHVARADAGSVARRALDLSPDGQRPRGRPKKRWMDCLRDDMRLVGVRSDDAADRTRWRTKCRRADPAPARE